MMQTKRSSSRCVGSDQLFERTQLSPLSASRRPSLNNGEGLLAWEAVDDIISTLLKLLTEGKSAADVLPIVMGVIIMFLLNERKALVAENKKKEEKIDKIVDDYYRGNLTLTEALNSLKLVLFEIKGKL